MRDFLWAVAAKLQSLGLAAAEPAKPAVYFGRLWQGEKTPCFYLPPPALRRKLLPCGRVRREISLELHYYPRQRKPVLADKETAADRADSAASRQESGIGEQTRVGEGLARGMTELQGRQRAYRGQHLSWQPGNDHLLFRADYVYYTTLELEAADGLGETPETADLMQYFEILAISSK